MIWMENSSRKCRLKIIKKAGDVIPEVVEPIIDRRNGSEVDFKMTDECPICHSKIIRKALDFHHKEQL